MRKTALLGLPIYDKPSEDKFKLNDWNVANENVERAFSSAINGKSLDIINTEVAEARGEEPTLKVKINKIGAEIEKKITKGSVSISDIDRNLGKIDQSYLSDSLLQQMAGTTPINSVPADFSVTQDKMSVPFAYAKRSKNLFNKGTVKTGFYVNYQSGSEIANANYCTSDFILVDSGTDIRISGTIEQLALYDDVKKYVSGVVKASDLLTIPSNVKYIKLTLRPTEINSVQVEKGNVVTNYSEFYYTLDTDKIVEEIPHNKLDKTLIKGVLSKNLFNKDDIVIDTFINYEAGNERTLAGYFSSTFIEINHSKKYFISGTTEQLAIYDESKKYIKGYAKVVDFNSTVLPTNTRFVRISGRTTELPNIQIEEGTEATSYEKFCYKITEDNLPKSFVDRVQEKKKVVNLYVDITGVKGNSSLRNCLENIKDSSQDKVYNVYISPGEYDVYSEYSADEINNTSFIGLKKPPFVNLIGIAGKEKTIIKGELTSDYGDTTIGRVSTLVTLGTGKLKGLTITAKNLRYAVHDDYNYNGLERECEDCNFIKISGGYEQAYGGGVFSNNLQKFRNCRFESSVGMPFSFHNNKNFTQNSKIELNNCKFYNTHPTKNISVRFGSMGSGTTEEVEIIGCYLNKSLSLFEEQNNGVGCDFSVSGYGNNDFSISVTGTTSKNFINQNGMIL